MSIARPTRAGAACEEQEGTQEQAQQHKIQARKELQYLRDHIDAQRELWNVMIAHEWGCNAASGAT